MTALNWRTVATAAIASFGLFVGTTAARAYDGERWEHERWEHRHHYYEGHEDHWRHEGPRVVYYERQPVYVAPPPAYQAPMPSGLNLNFSIPLQ